MAKKIMLSRLHQPVYLVFAVVLIGLIISGYVFAFVFRDRQSSGSHSQQYKTQSIPTTAPTLFDTPTPNQPKIFHSKLMQITIAVPDGFQVIEVWPNALTLESSEGKIEINRIYSNEVTLDAAIALLEEENQMKKYPVEIEKHHVTVNGLDAVLEVATSQTYPKLPQFNYKAYDFFPAKYTMYTIFTSTPALYSTLDQVAPSIKF